MLFNTIDFAIFLPVVFFLYWFLFKSLKQQNLFLIVSNFIFYGWWDWRFLGLLCVSTIVDYLVGLKLHTLTNSKSRKTLLLVSITVNLGILCFFKYFNFFIENFIQSFTFLGFPIAATSLNIILPVGISFYTFQTMSYTIDIYNHSIEPTRNFPAFLAFVSFFPQLVAGPIERASHFLPQFLKNRFFSYYAAADGMRQILWGFFKKIVIADNCAPYVNQIFDNPSQYSGSSLFIGIFLFAFQIYGDFSGYSDIASGTARLFGFSLMDNFKFPYFSKNISEFWKRWHISLSSWFKDYVYIPLGGNRVSPAKKIRNILIVFVLSGFWHGARWNYIYWGFFNALLLILFMYLSKNKHQKNQFQASLFPDKKKFFQIVCTFFLTLIAWVFFRSPTVSHAFSYLHHMLSLSLFSAPDIFSTRIVFVFATILLFIIAEWFGKHETCALQYVKNFSGIYRYMSYYIILAFILFFGTFNANQFIYFQF